MKEDVKKKRDSVVADAVPRGGRSDTGTAARRAAATAEGTEGVAAKSDSSAASCGLRPPGQRVVRATKGTAAQRAAATAEGDGHRPPLQTAKRVPGGSVNPLFDLPEEQRAKLFVWLRECPYDDAVQHMLRDQGIAEATRAQLSDFFQFEAEQHWEKRIGRAAQEANALIQLVEKSPVRFSNGILAALGQEAFRQVASGEAEPQSMGRLATLFLKARSDERADQMQELKREKLQRELQGQVDHALEKLAEEVDKHPVARAAFEALRQELTATLEKVEAEV
jgi:hypothetical protein